MKAYLMYKDRDFDLKAPLPWNEQDLTQDLELNTLFNAMAGEDKFLFEVAKVAVLTGLKNDQETIRYRQAILNDCLKNSGLVREIYDLAVETIASEKTVWWGYYNKIPSSVLYRANELMQIFVRMLKKLRKFADDHASQFEAEGFTRFFTMLQKELDDEYLARVEDHLKRLKFDRGVLISADLGPGNKGYHYVLRKPNEVQQSWFDRIFGPRLPGYTYTIADRDEAGARALSELKDRGLNHVANALAQSSDHILSFFKMLRTELAFYVGCLNLQEQLAQMGEPICFPTPETPGVGQHAYTGLYDLNLALTMKQRVVGNDGDADGKELILITGANQGGKSTFLRSIGLSQMMLQCGMFAPALSLRANLVDNLFTHYKREEDVTMESGKLDEELSRMSAIIDRLTPHSLILFNESFAATNDREGSEIARQIVTALLNKHIKMFYVTHLYEFAHSLYLKEMGNILFLRAQRQPDGSRTFKIVPGNPLQTSFGEDLYRKVFGADQDYIPVHWNVNQNVQGD
jgi:DNA mismatch repair ATPase MutS